MNQIHETPLKREYLGRIEDELENLKLSTSKKKILREYFEFIYQRVQDGEIQKKFGDRIVRITKRFSIVLGDKEFNQVSKEDYSEFYDTFNGGQLTKRTRENYETILRSFCKWYFDINKLTGWEKVEAEIINVFRQAEIPSNMLVNPLERKEQVRLRSIQRHINAKDLLSEQRQKLQEFDDYRSIGAFGKKVSTHCRISNMSILHQYGAFVKKPYEKITKRDIQAYIKALELRQLSEHSINHYKVTIKIFHRWLTTGRVKEGEDFPELVDDIVLQRLDTTKRKEDMLSDEEIMRLFKVADNFRDKCIVFLIYEMMLRVQEACSIQLKHISHDDHGFIINVKRNKRKGKKDNVKMIPFRIIESEPSLRNLLNHHPLKDDPNAYLFLASNIIGSPISGEAIRRIIHKLAKKAGITKRVHPHILRHSKVTNLRLSGFPDHHIVKLVGWSNHKMLNEVYSHTDEMDANNAILVRAGKIVDKVKIESKALEPIICSRCDKSNSPDSIYCNCGQALNRVKAMEDDQNKELAINQAMEFMHSMMKKPQLMNEYKKFVLDKEM